MKIGIIVYSQTGNTLSVAERIKENLLQDGNIVSIERVIAETNDPGNLEIKLKSIPNINTYDVIVLGSPVQGFSLAPVMKKYLEQITNLNNKKVICYATQHFPYSWMGGNRAISQMEKECRKTSEDIYNAGVVNWSSKEKENKINNVIMNVKRALIQ
jgi:flavodoxin